MHFFFLKSVRTCSVPVTRSHTLWDALIPGLFTYFRPPARKFPQKTLTNPCPSGNIYRQSVRLRIEYGRVPEWPMGTDCKSAAFSFGGSNPPAPTKKTSVENTLVFCSIRYLKLHSRGWIRTAAATSLKTAQKQPSGLFLAARLATSTRAHQTREIRTYFRLEKGSDFSFSSGLKMKAPVDDAKLRYLVIDRKPITRIGGCDYEVR